MISLKHFLQLLEEDNGLDRRSIILTIPIRRLFSFLIFTLIEDSKANITAFEPNLGELPCFTYSAIFMVRREF